MPRVSKEAKAASHARIVKEAARQFREKGIEATGLAEIMKAAGMTHGGFYRHFGSKEELTAAAISLAFDEILQRLDDALETGDRDSALRDFVHMHLSEQHVAQPGFGCPIVALGSEAARGSAVEREAITRGVDRSIERLAEVIGGEADEARSRASGLLSLLVGTVILARSAPSRQRMEEILLAGRRQAFTSLGL